VKVMAHLFETHVMMRGMPEAQVSASRPQQSK
jgi:hypothetical protein